MLGAGTRSLIFVDIDGVPLPLRARPADTGHWVVVSAAAASHGAGNPLLGRLDPGDSPRLAALPGDLVWASTWMTEANEVIAPRLGLPALLLVDWPEVDEQPPRGVHWKTVPLTRYAADRSFVWSMTRSPTPIAGGSPGTTRTLRCCTASIHTAG